MAIHNDLDNHLRRVVGISGYSVSGSTATLPTTTLDARRLNELMDIATTIKHDISLAAGVLTIKPR